MYRIQKTQPTGLKNINKSKGPSEDASVSLGREKKATTGVRKGGRDLGEKGDREEKRGIWSGIGWGKGLKP